MAPLSWNEIRTRALAFSREWAGESREHAEAKSFWDAFFQVFGLNRRRIASFEEPVKLLGKRRGNIDLFWKGHLLVEHKSLGKDLDAAYTQATDYFEGVKEEDLPRYVLVTDFDRIRLYDLDSASQTEFHLKEFSRHIKEFGFIAGYQPQVIKEQDPVNIKAAELMGALHDQLKAIGYTGHDLEVYLVRLLFCMFAEGTTIFEPGQFREYIEQRTHEDGSDLAGHLAELFEVLNTPVEKRLKTLDEHLAAFPYVNGRLFKERLSHAGFDSRTRSLLLRATAVDWSKISPAIFGSMFQSVMDPKARRNLGAHYTSETNILKVIDSLFLNDLKAEFLKAKGNRKRLEAFHHKLSNLKFFDPACGCGNFLIIAYREIRLLELEVLLTLYGDGAQAQDIGHIIRCEVDQFFGIEKEEFPAQIAQVALWLMDHQMNLKVSEAFGQYYIRLPLSKSATIVHDNALQVSWKTILPPMDCSYLMGNPPFVGAMVMDDEQREDIDLVFGSIKGAGVLDYVAAWYLKAAQYTQGVAIRCAFVSTNSITQGEQVGILWRELFKEGLIINFAHRTFRWSNEARGKAAVHCVIIGFSRDANAAKTLFDYHDIGGEPHALVVSNINPYLVDGPDVLLENRSVPLCKVPAMRFGSMPRDGGNLILSPDEKKELLHAEPKAAPLVRRYTGAEEFLNGGERYCLWLVDASPELLKSLPKVRARCEAVRDFRLKSKAATTRKFAQTPSLFCQIAQPETDYLLVPRVSSERRNFVPIAFEKKNLIANDQVFTVSGATLYHFGVMNSSMHMAWVRSVCGRLKSDYRYSKDIVYNNFPWPETLSEKQRKAIEDGAKVILDVRATFSGTTLAELYDPLSMPSALVKAHQALDRVVDKAYVSDGGRASWSSDAERVAFLFNRYQAITAPLLPVVKSKSGVKAKK